jgi:hypothetical protein
MAMEPRGHDSNHCRADARASPPPMGISDCRLVESADLSEVEVEAKAKAKVKVKVEAEVEVKVQTKAEVEEEKRSGTASQLQVVSRCACSEHGTPSCGSRPVAGR